MKNKARRYDLPGYDILRKWRSPDRINLNKMIGKNSKQLFLDPNMNLARHKKNVSILRTKNKELKSQVEIQKSAASTLIK